MSPTPQNTGDDRMRLLLSGAVIIGLFGTIPEPASAQFYGPGPWCAVTNQGIGDFYWDCQFWSLQHCASNVIAGNRGFCNQNPSFVPGPRDRRYRRSYRY
jgi:hypothetical protein